MSKEAMKLALEAMKRIQNADMDCDFLNVRQADQLDEAITALREALADQPAQQEPVGRLESDPDEGHVFVPRIDGDWSMLGEDLYTAPPAQRKPLTDEECDRIYTALDQWAREFDQYEFGLPTHCGDGMIGGRAIIRAAHGIKENT